MSSPCIAPCVSIPLYRPWWQRVLDGIADRRRAAPRPSPDLSDPGTWHARDLDALRGLDHATLRDIGAPEWVRGDASATDRLGLDLMRL